jgi:hypothetical protein
MRQARAVEVSVAAALAALFWPVGSTRGQEDQTAVAASAASSVGQVWSEADIGAEELPAQVRGLLATVEDFSFDFDHPGYFAVLGFVRESPHAPGFSRPPVNVSDWQEFVERPRDFRGLPVTITGIVGRNKDPYIHERHPELGAVFQTELWSPEQAVTCTVIFTQDVRDVPVGATVTVTGYFVKINRYPRHSGEPGISALIVAPGPVAISRQAARALQGRGEWWLLAAAAGAGLVIAVIVLRAARRIGSREARWLPASRPAPMNLSQELAEWAQRELPETEAVDPKHKTPPGVGC